MQHRSSTSGRFPETGDINPGSVYHDSEVNQHHSMSNRSPQEGTSLSNSGESLIATGNANAHGIDGFIAWSSNNPGSGNGDARSVDGFSGWRRSHPNSTWNHEDLADVDGTKDPTEERIQEGQDVLNQCLESGRLSRAEPPSVICSHNQLTPRQTDFQALMGSINSRPADATSINSVESGSSEPSLELLRTSSRNFSHIDDTGGSSGSSTGTWGFSCKRRAYEGTLQQSQHSSSSSGVNLQAENPSHLGCRGPSISPGGMSLTPSLWHSPGSSFLEQWNPRGETAGRDIDFEPCPSTRAHENSQRLLSRHVDLESIPQQESAPFNISSGRTYRHPHSFAWRQQYRPEPSSEGISIGSTLRVGSASRLPAVANALNGIGVSGGTPILPTYGTSQLRGGNSSSFLRAATTREELHHRNSASSISEVPMFSVANEARSTVMHVGQSSNDQPSSSTWGTNQMQTPIQQRLFEAAPWSLFPVSNSVTEHLSANMPGLSSGPSAHDATSSNGGNAQTHPTLPQRSGLLMNIQDEDEDAYIPDYLRNLTSEVRTRLLAEIRQVFDALDQGERVAIEEFFVFDPFVHHGLLELHDRHVDMRLDVDNMSYEELLALGERIGDVSTGLSKETILKCMKHKKKLGSDVTESTQEPCCICQEEYVDGDDLGILDCGHEFHSECIPHWLTQKNLCPICKTTGLVT